MAKFFFYGERGEGVVNYKLNRCSGLVQAETTEEAFTLAQAAVEAQLGGQEDHVIVTFNKVED